MRQKNPFKKNKYEIIYRLINSVLAGLLVFLGALSDGYVGSSALVAIIAVSMIAVITQFKDYWKTQEREYKSMALFTFIT